jgi:hypothetical protein
VKASRAWTILFLIATAACLPAHADGMADAYAAWSASFTAFSDPNTGLTMFPLLVMSTGGRAEGMGGAATALGGGVEGLDANPAGSALMRGGELFLSHRNGISDSSIEGVAAAGSTGSLGIGAFAKVFFVPFTEYDASGLPGGSGYFTETVLAGNVALRLLALPGDGGIAAGAHLKAAARVVPQAVAPGQSALAFAADAGVLARLRLPSLTPPASANFGVGAVLRNVPLWAMPAGSPLPTALTFAVAYAPVGPVTIDADVDVPVSLDGGGVPAQGIRGAVGIEVRMSGFAAVYAGCRLQGDNPRLTMGARLGIGQLDLVVNYAVDLMGGVNPLENYSVAATVSLGG